MKYSLTLFLFSLKIVVYAQPGILDNSFGSGGIVTTDFGNNFAFANSAAIQSDGKIVVAGEDNYHFAIARYNSNGSLDNTFDLDGKAFTVIGDESHARSVCIQNDGKILVGGYSLNGGWHFTLVRYTSSGNLDSSFDNDGIVTTVPGRITSITIQNDGKILAAGGGWDFVLARFNSDGSLDTTFSSDGIVSMPVGYNSEGCSSMALQSDGKIVLGGYITKMNTEPADCILVRYNTNGTLDSTFSSDGKVILSVNHSSSLIHSIAIQHDGKIVATGISSDYLDWYFTLLRFNSNGDLDNTFSADGIVTNKVGLDGKAYSLALQTDGKILVAGTTSSDSHSDFALARYNSDGSLDNAFDSDGIVTTSIGSSDDHAHSVIIQPDNKIVVTGFTYSSNSYDFAIARYNGDNFVGSLENKEINDVSVYPNPSSGIITVNLTTPVDKKICVYDLLGNCVFEKVLVKNEQEIDLADQPKAIYFMEILSEGQKVVKKIVLR